jgi:hypothetical protein
MVVKKLTQLLYPKREEAHNCRNLPFFDDENLLLGRWEDCAIGVNQCPSGKCASYFLGRNPAPHSAVPLNRAFPWVQQYRLILARAAGITLARANSHTFGCRKGLQLLTSEAKRGQGDFSPLTEESSLRLKGWSSCAFERHFT